MTIEEAKKIIDMCVDAVKKGDGEDAKIYVNKEYVLSILDMVETPINIPGTNIPQLDPATSPVWPPTWPQVWYKDHTDGSNPDFEKVPWWVWYKDYNQFTCDATSTGSKPTDADVVMTTAGTADKSRQMPEELQRFRDSLNSNSAFAKAPAFDASPKRTDCINDWAGGDSTKGALRT